MEIHGLQQKIFDILYAIHESEKKDGREFYFNVQSYFSGGKHYYFEPNNELVQLLFWENEDIRWENNNVSLCIDRVFKTAYLMVNTDKSEKMTEFAEMLSLNNISANSYDKTYTYYNLNDFLRVFVATELPIINEYIGDILPQISKQRFEQKLSEARFNLQTPNELTKSFMPTCISSIHIHNFKGLRNLEIDEIPLDTQFIFVTGKSGSGKTIFLQSLALGALGLEDCLHKEKIEMEDNNSFIGVHKFIYNKPKSSSNIAFQAFKNPYRNFAFFGVERLEVEKKKNDRAKTHGLFKNGFPLMDFNRELFFIKTNLHNISKFRLIESVLCDFCGFMSIEIDMFKKQVYYVYANGKQLYYEQFSHGTRDIFNMVGNIFMELMSKETIPTRWVHGIVMIDSIESYLPQQWVNEFIQKLAYHFPKVQFVISAYDKSIAENLSAKHTFIEMYIDENGQCKAELSCKKS